MMRRLSPTEFASMAINELSPAQGIALFRAFVTNFDDPSQAPALRDVASDIAHHADHLDRLIAENASGSLGGRCLPGVPEPAPGHSPSGDPGLCAGADIVRGAFTEVLE